MEEEKVTLRSILKSISESLTLKALTIAAIIIVLLIPRSMVEGLVHERMARSQGVIYDISSKWGGAQQINGPILTIPISKIEKLHDSKGHVTERLIESYMHSYPESLEISGEMKHELRKRSIFAAVLYDSDLKFKAKFQAYQRNQYPINSSWTVHLDKAFLSFGISDPTGISSGVAININDKSHQAQPGTLIERNISKGFHIPYPLKKEALNISFSMKLRGSDSFSVNPAAKESKLSLSSTWADPSFQGSFLPSQREVSDTGFSADWEVHDLQRSSRQTWLNDDSNHSPKLMSVKFLQVNDAYQRILRIIKYAVLFIIFTFAAVFITERLTNSQVHPLQYFITGLASLIFYLLLLSLSEQFSFNLAYVICATATTFLITAYSKGIFRGWKVSATMGGVCVFLYSFLFGTLQLQDYALLMGSTGLVVILAIVMFLTRKINREENRSTVTSMA